MAQGRQRPPSFGGGAIMGLAKKGPLPPMAGLGQGIFAQLDQRAGGLASRPTTTRGPPIARRHSTSNGVVANRRQDAPAENREAQRSRPLREHGANASAEDASERPRRRRSQSLPVQGSKKRHFEGNDEGKSTIGSLMDVNLKLPSNCKLLGYLGRIKDELKAVVQQQDPLVPADHLLDEPLEDPMPKGRHQDCLPLEDGAAYPADMPRSPHAVKARRSDRDAMPARRHSTATVKPRGRSGGSKYRARERSQSPLLRSASPAKRGALAPMMLEDAIHQETRADSAFEIRRHGDRGMFGSHDFYFDKKESWRRSRSRRGQSRSRMPIENSTRATSPLRSRHRGSSRRDSERENREPVVSTALMLEDLSHNETRLDGASDVRHSGEYGMTERRDFFFDRTDAMGHSSSRMPIEDRLRAGKRYDFTSNVFESGM